MNRGEDQADGLRRLLGAGAAARIVAVAGMAPGAGASTAALNLGAAFARGGQPVLLLDEHAPHPLSAAAVWGRAATGTLADVARGHRALAAAAARLSCGVSLLPAPAGATPGSFNPRTLCRAGIIMVDVALDADGQLSPLARLADEVLIVMQPVASSITAAYAGLKRLHYTHVRQSFRFLVNGAVNEQQAQLVTTNIVNTSSRYLAVSLAPAGWVRHDPLVPEAARARLAVVQAHPASAAAADFQRAAAALGQRLAPRPAPARPTRPALASAA